MEQYKTEAVALMDTFYKSTGVGALCLDKHMNMVACVPASHAFDDSTDFAMNQIKAFLKNIYSEPRKRLGTERQFYTFFMEFNFICNIVLIRRDDQILGAIITELVLVRKLNQEEAEDLLNQADILLKDRRTLESILLKVPVLSYDRLMPMGKILYGLSKTFFPDVAPHQVLQRADPESLTTLKHRHFHQKNARDIPNVARHTPFSTYLLFKEAIQNGDTASLLDMMNRISAGSIPMDQLNRANFIRSVKDSFIKSCALGCYAAIEGSAPYERVMDLSDEFIRKMETLDNIYDIYDLMKNVMISFARMVSISGALYSKPVHQVLEYIEGHYREKITLQQLSEHTGLSTFYLSNLIHKETGLILTDNINKIRVEKSKQLLRNQNSSILEIAQSVGFTYQNHYAATFKKFTGVTPSEYRKSLGLCPSGPENTQASSGILPAIYDQVHNMLKMFPGMYDVARIVDPVQHLSWIVQEKESLPSPETCYQFWNRHESCENCISKRAYLMNDTIFKLETGSDRTFLVLATPKTIGKKVFIVEVLKELPDKSF